LNIFQNKMPSQKNQHYVPKFYLKKFSQDNKNLNIYTINNKKFVSGSINHQCSKSYFYSKDTAIELILSKLESKEFSAVNKLIKERSLNKIDYDDYIDILEFISIMHGRTLTKKKEIEQMLDDFNEKIFKPMFRADPLSKGLSDKDIAGIKLKNRSLHLLGIQIGVRGAILLSDLVPVLLVNNTNTEFWISDHPIVFFNNAFHHLSGVSMCAHTSNGLQVFCPLSHNIALFLFHSPYYKIRMNKKHKVKLLDDDVKELNKLQFFSCYNSIFYQSKNQEKDINRLHESLGIIPQKPYMFSSFDKITDQHGNTKEVFHTSGGKIPYVPSLSFIKTRKIKAGSISLVRNKELNNLFEELFNRLC